jgi:hypothetical protein
MSEHGARIGLFHQMGKEPCRPYKYEIHFERGFLKRFNREP